MGSFTHKDGWS